MANIPGEQSKLINAMQKPTQIENPAIKMLEKKMKDPKQIPEMIEKIGSITKTPVGAEGATDRYREKVTGILNMHLKEENAIRGLLIGAGIGIIAGFSMFASHPSAIAITLVGGMMGLVAGAVIGVNLDWRDAEKVYNSLKEAGIVKE